MPEAASEVRKETSEGIEYLDRKALPRPSILKQIVLFALPILIGLAVWQVVAVLVSSLRHVPFPTPLDTLRRAIELFGLKPFLEHTIFTHTVASLFRWAVGFGVASVCGILIGTALGRASVLHSIFMPLVYVLQLIPGLAWIPVTILMFGIGEGSTIFMIAMTGFAPVVINAVAGMRSANKMHIAAARMVGASPSTIFWKVLVPGSVPHLLSGLRVALANSWRVVVAAEMIVGTGTGLGYSIIQSRWTLDYASAFVCIFVIALIGLVTERLLFERIEKRTIQRWGMVEA